MAGEFDHPRCPHCGGPHAGACPRVRAAEYHPDGTLKRVEYWPGPAAGPLPPWWPAPAWAYGAAATGEEG